MAQWEQTLSTNDIQKYSLLDNIKNDSEITFPGYAICLPRYSKLNGKFSNLNEIDTFNIGYMSESLSDDKGVFGKPPVITCEFARKKTSGGIHFVFNRVSGDYCSELQITWYKGEKELATKTYYPTNADYICKSDVGLFDKFIVTFYKTSNPYRYLWLGIIDNYRLTQSDGLQIVYYDVAYKAKENIINRTFNGTMNEKISDPSVLSDERERSYPEYAYTLPRYARLDGSYHNTPDTFNDACITSLDISDENGQFNNGGLELQVTLSERITSTGITFYFNKTTGDYCTEGSIKWLYNDEVLKSVDYSYPNHNDTTLFIDNPVSGYNKVIVKFTKTSKPYRYAFITGIQFGNVRIYDEAEIVKCNVVQEIASISDELPISVANFTVRNNKNISIDIQRRQTVEVYFNKAIVGVFYLSSGLRQNEYEYALKTENAISFLEEADHYGGIYKDKLAKELIEEIFIDEGVKLYIDDVFEETTVTGYLPYDSKRNNLKQILFAIGAVVSTSFDNQVFIYPYEAKKAYIKITDSQIYSDTTEIDSETPVSGVALTVHSYKANNNESTLFDNVLYGQSKITFSDPMHDLTIEGGTIEESGTNYAVISGTGENVKLIGHEYDHIESIIKKENEMVYRGKNVKEIESATLVNNDNAYAVLNRIYGYLTHTEELKASVLLEELELGDIAKIDTFDGERNGIIESLDMSFTHDIKAEIKMKCLN